MRFLQSAIMAAFLLPVAAGAQEARDSKLYGEILRADETLFEQGYNRCDQAALERVIAGDLAFFHDENGTSTNKVDFLRGFNQSICSTPERKPIRQLLPGTMEVFALRNEGKLYGAIQTAMHQFFIREPGKALYKTNIARITNVWILNQGIWQLKTSLSYDHRDPRTDKR